MITIGIKDLRNGLSRYLSSVKNGEEILITERGKIFARIVREKPDKIRLRTELEPLIKSGQITMPVRQINREITEPIAINGKPVSEMVMEDRR